jgi:hypothetical protein
LIFFSSNHQKINLKLIFFSSNHQKINLKFIFWARPFTRQVLTGSKPKTSCYYEWLDNRTNVETSR